jgi:predicted adenylyl cyclase CyaB
MCAEIEAKLKVDSHEQIVRKLDELGAEFTGEQRQTDSYFDDAERALTKTDRCLRLRRQKEGDSEKVLLAYKGAKEEDDFKKRRQIEIEVSSTDGAGKLLGALGYESALIVEKTRRLWLLGGCEVAIDEVAHLGSFVEIEGPDGKSIAEVQSRLGLAHLDHVVDSYACLVEQKLRRKSVE